jgi:hypothetical protein
MGAKCFDGSKAALAAGLADAPGDLTDAWVDLCTEIQRPKMPMMAAAKQGSVASATEERRESMAEEKKPVPAEATQPAAAAAATGAPPLGISVVGVAAPIDESAAILELCAVAGLSASAASEFIGKKLTRAQVFAEIQKQRVAASGPEIASHILPDAGTSTEAKPSETALGRNARERAAKAKGGK